MLDLLISSKIFLVIIAILPTIFWILFFYFSSNRKTTSKNSLAVVFLVSIAGVFVALLLERVVFSFLPKDFTSFLFNNGTVDTLRDVFFIFLVSFFIIALIEELLKFEILYTVSIKSKSSNQIIDYIKLGIATGLGFATAENVYYFIAFQRSEVFTVVNFFMARLFLSTLAHIIYGAVMGYYLGHAAYYKLYSKNFIRKSIVAAFLLHGLFNFLIFVNVSFYNVILVITALLIMLKWFKDRRFLEQIGPNKNLLPVSQLSFSETLELRSYLSLGETSSEQRKVILKKLTFCQFCLSKMHKGEEFCLKCKRKIE